MEGPLPSILPVPRLRLSRFNMAGVYDTAGASSSRDRLSDTPLAATVDLNQDLDDDDDQPTPKMSSSAALTVTADTPAARLRALLSRVPAHSKSPSMPLPPPHTPSEIESDFDSPTGMHSATTSIARESLKDIFSRALRDPGNTPQKEKGQTRWRRNSIDASEVEASPQAQRERAKNKGKRRSMSDEEIENPSKSSRRSESSFKSSQAATFDILRERLTNSHTQLKDQHLPHSLYEHLISDDDTNDTTTFLQDLNSSRATPPAATSTPQQSLRMSVNSQFPLQSNLLDQDSEMQRAIEGLDSYDGDSGPGHHPVPFPPSRPSNTQMRPQSSPAQGPQRSQSVLSHPTVHAFDKPHGSVLTRRGSEELHRSSSRASSSGGNHSGDYQDRIREREREWNRPKNPARPHTPELTRRPSHGQISRSTSPITGATARTTLSHRGSTTSLRSYDDNSSRGSSFGSQAEYRERIDELERERNVEREREWNKRHSKLSRPTSSLGTHSPVGSEPSRSHIISHQKRPYSAQSQLSPGSPKYHRPDLHHHFSFSPTSRASSPTGSSRASHHGKEDGGSKMAYEKEHMPHSQWNKDEYAHGSDPPSPSTASPRHHPPANRLRADSLQMHSTTKGQSPVHREQRVVDSSTLEVRARLSPRASSPLPRGNLSSSTSPSHLQPQSQIQSHHPSHPTRPHSYLSSTEAEEKEKEIGNIQASTVIRKAESKTPSSGSRHFGYSFARNRIPLPPLDFEKEATERPTPSYHRPSSSLSPNHDVKPINQASGSARPSHIPVWSPKKVQSVSSGSVGGHPRLPIEPSFADSKRGELSSQPPSRANAVESRYHEGSGLRDDQEEDEAVGQERTPTIRTIAPPTLETPEYTPPRSPSPPLRQKTHASDESRLHKALSSNNAAVLQELSPPPSPSADQISVHSTPPRRPSSRLEFQTPSPPKGLPELPGPPMSSSEDEQEEGHIEWTHTPTHDLRCDSTTMKTPRPPGAWASTPGPRKLLERTRPLSTDTDIDTQYDSGLATPVASLSKASSLPTQTPLPPGAWMATPVARKSILKVRFDTQAPGSEQLLSGEVIKSPEDPTTSIVDASWPPENVSANKEIVLVKSSTPHTSTDANVRGRTPEPSSTPVSSRSPRSPSRKSPSIRILNAFGHEERLDEEGKASKATSANDAPRSMSSIRIVDATGREVKDGDELGTFNDPNPPLRHNDALVRVRQGLSALAQDLEDMDRAKNDPLVDRVRLHELDDASWAARESRKRLSQSLQTAEINLRKKLEPLQASMSKRRLLIPAVVDRRLSRFRLNSWLFWSVVCLQLLLILIMYRISTARAKDLFLTTYYDPFYPDLHLYTSRPDTLHQSMFSSFEVSWLSVPNTLRHQGWKASTGEIWDNISVVVADWQKQVWDTWGSDSVQQDIPWPPT